MTKHSKINERERLLRVELAKRTVYAHRGDDDERRLADDSPEVLSIGKKIADLIEEERLEEAREQLQQELKKYPNEMMFLNIQVILDGLDKPFGNYDSAKKYCSLLMECAVKKDNIYYTWVALNNMALIANNEGHDEYSKAMYLAAHFLDRKAIGPLINIAGWNARRNNLEEAQKWIELILEIHPEWPENDELVTAFKKEESLHNLRSYEPFIKKVLTHISQEQKHG